MPKNRDKQNQQPEMPPVTDYYYQQFEPVRQEVGEDIAKTLPTLGGPGPGAMRDRMPRLGGDEPAPGDAARGDEPYGKNRK